MAVCATCTAIPARDTAAKLDTVVSSSLLASCQYDSCILCTLAMCGRLACRVGWNQSCHRYCQAGRPCRAVENPAPFCYLSTLGRCQSGQHCSTKQPGKPDSVRALQLANGGRTLAVLSATGFLEGWNLTSGLLLGRWRFSGAVSAMCHNGRDLLLCRRGDGGTVLEVAALPAVLTEYQNVSNDEQHV